MGEVLSEWMKQIDVIVKQMKGADQYAKIDFGR